MAELKVTLKGGEMTYLAAGASGDPVILYIHGNLGSRLWFRDVLEIPGFRCLAPDMPNFGKSYASGDFSMAGYASAMEDFLAVLDIGNAVVVGHSLGGVVAMEMVARQAESINGLKIRKILLISPGPIEGLVTPKEHYPIIETYRNNRPLLKTALGAVIPSLHQESLLDELVDEGLKMHPGAFLGHPDELGRADYRERLGKLDMPALLIRGEIDMLITSEMCERTADHLGAEYRVLPGVGHSPIVENPSLFLDNLKTLLEKSDGC